MARRFERSAPVLQELAGRKGRLRPRCRPEYTLLRVFTFTYPKTRKAMKNNRLDALLRRDANAQLGLLEDKALYAPIEDDIAPLRAAHGAALAEARQLADEVFEADGDDSAGVKRGTRALLRTLAGRIGKAVVAHAASGTNTDERLAERIRPALAQLPSADSATFAQAATVVQHEAAALAPHLTKREVTAADLTELDRLIRKFSQRLATGRAADVKGKTARETLSKLLQNNTRLLQQIRQQLAPYKGTAREKALLNFDSYAKVVVFNTGGPAR